MKIFPAIALVALAAATPGQSVPADEELTVSAELNKGAIYPGEGLGLIVTIGNKSNRERRFYLDTEVPGNRVTGSKPDFELTIDGAPSNRAESVVGYGRIDFMTPGLRLPAGNDEKVFITANRYCSTLLPPNRYTLRTRFVMRESSNRSEVGPFEFLLPLEVLPPDEEAMKQIVADLEAQVFDEWGRQKVSEHDPSSQLLRFNESPQAYAAHLELVKSDETNPYHGEMLAMYQRAATPESIAALMSMADDQELDNYFGVVSTTMIYELRESGDPAILAATDAFVASHPNPREVRKQAAANRIALEPIGDDDLTVTSELTKRQIYPGEGLGITLKIANKGTSKRTLTLSPAPDEPVDGWSQFSLRVLRAGRGLTRPIAGHGIGGGLPDVTLIIPAGGNETVFVMVNRYCSTLLRPKDASLGVQFILEEQSGEPAIGPFIVSDSFRVLPPDDEAMKQIVDDLEAQVFDEAGRQKVSGNDPASLLLRFNESPRAYDAHLKLMKTDEGNQFHGETLAMYARAATPEPVAALMRMADDQEVSGYVRETSTRMIYELREKGDAEILSATEAFVAAHPDPRPPKKPESQ